MTTDTLPAAVTDAATAVTLDGARVHRDWRQTGAEATGTAAAVTAGSALYTATFGHTVLAWLLANASGVAFLACVAFLILMTREGRRWTYADDDNQP